MRTLGAVCGAALLAQALLAPGGVAQAGQQCTFISDGMGGGTMSCHDPDAESRETMQMLQQLKQQQAEAQARAQRPAAPAPVNPVPAPQPTPAQADAFLVCTKRANEAPDANRMAHIFGTENGFHPPAALKNRYATKADAKSISRFQADLIGCFVPPYPYDPQFAEIYMRFISGLSTYGETADALRGYMERMVHESAAMMAQPPAVPSSPPQQP
jgi:hypothetical protein